MEGLVDLLTGGWIWGAFQPYAPEERLALPVSPFHRSCLPQSLQLLNALWKLPSIPTTSLLATNDEKSPPKITEMQGSPVDELTHCRLVEE